MLAASLILKTCWTYGISTSFREVRDPHMKNRVVRMASGPKYDVGMDFVVVPA